MIFFHPYKFLIITIYLVFNRRMTEILFIRSYITATKIQDRNHDKHRNKYHRRECKCADIRISQFPLIHGKVEQGERCQVRHILCNTGKTCETAKECDNYGKDKVSYNKRNKNLEGANNPRTKDSQAYPLNDSRRQFSVYVNH